MFDEDQFKKVELPNGCIVFIPKDKLVELIKQATKDNVPKMKDGGTLCLDVIETLISIHVEIGVYDVSWIEEENKFS